MARIPPPRIELPTWEERWRIKCFCAELEDNHGIIIPFSEELCAIIDAHLTVIAEVDWEESNTIESREIVSKFNEFRGSLERIREYLPLFRDPEQKPHPKDDVFCHLILRALMNLTHKAPEEEIAKVQEFLSSAATIEQACEQMVQSLERYRGKPGRPQNRVYDVFQGDCT